MVDEETKVKERRVSGQQSLPRKGEGAARNVAWKTSIFKDGNNVYMFTEDKSHRASEVRRNLERGGTCSSCRGAGVDGTQKKAHGFAPNRGRGAS